MDYYFCIEIGMRIGYNYLFVYRKVEKKYCTLLKSVIGRETNGSLFLRRMDETISMNDLNNSI